MTDPSLLVRRYLEIFRANLTRMSATERDELTAEIQSHITEACNSGETVADVLIRMGPADRLAKAYMVDQLLAPKATGNRLGRFFAVAGIVTTMSLFTIVLVPLLAGLGLGLGLGGLAVIVAGVGAFAFPGLTYIIELWGLAQGAIVVAGAILTGLGALSIWGLVGYIRLVSSAARRVRTL